MIVLHHALKDLAVSDISKINFKNLDDLYDYLDNMCDRDFIDGRHDLKPPHTVYLFTYEEIIKDEDAEVYVTQRIGEVAQIILNREHNGLDIGVNTFYLFEFESFEEAYKVALNMKETSPLCYNK